MRLPPATKLVRPAIARVAAAMLATVATTMAAPADDGTDFFKQKIEPILRERCYECHSHEAGKTKGGLALDSRSGWSAGGGSGPAVVPGKVEKSLLVKAARREDADTAMPPKKPLPAAEVKLLEDWVQRGAPDPRTTELAVKPTADWWSLEPIVTVAEARERLGEEPSIDAFVARKLAEQGLRKSPEADRRTLIRRLYFDLHGLAPEPEEVEAFASDGDPQAYGKLVDRLLASPRYGERWARHWLDTIHFADTHGFEHDEIRSHAWRYRDYVIGALNADTRWPRFIREQLAADVFFPQEPERLAALGFLGAGPFDASAAGTAPKMFELIDRDDMVVQTMAAFASATVGCARCHDHKFDPISQQDYYAIAAVFAGVAKGDITYDADAAVKANRERWKQRADAAAKKNAAILLGAEAQAIALEWEQYFARIANAFSIAALPAEARAALAAPAEERTETARLAIAAHALAGKAAAELAALPPPAKVYAAGSEVWRKETKVAMAEPRVIHVLSRGELSKPGEVATPGGLACVAEIGARFELPDSRRESARRAALADWLADERNPLTWRSIVNRVWHYHFGRGLVDTPNDLGRMGSLPSHPELLDFLAADFRHAGGSLKRLHRQIVTSAVYRQASAEDTQPLAVAQDRDNRWLWRANRQRLDAESFRDIVLQKAGALDLTMGGPAAMHFKLGPPVQSTPALDYAAFRWDQPGGNRRSIYRLVFRNIADPFMVALDFPDAAQLAPVRPFSASALQALALWNDNFVLHYSAQVAARIEKAAPDAREGARSAAKLILLREPAEGEAAEFARYAEKHGLAALCRVLFNANEFLFVN